MSAQLRESRCVSFPFAAITGTEAAREALLLLAVDPLLKGVLISGGPGSGKSTLIRGFQALVEEPFVEVPLGVTADRLIGGLDLRRSIESSAPVASSGLLSCADGGYLCVHDANLLDRALSCEIARALESGEVLLEREGLSLRCSSRFSLVGCYDPAEGAVDPAVADAVGMVVGHAIDFCGLPARAKAGDIKRSPAPPSPCSHEDHAEVLRRLDLFSRNPEAFAGRFAGETARLRSLIDGAKQRLPAVRMSRDQLELLTSAAACLRVQGHRADIFAFRAARARAALAGRAAVDGEDLRTAVQLVLEPRSRAQDERPSRTAGAVAPAASSPSRQQPEDTAVAPADCPPPDATLDTTAPGAGRRRRGSGDAPYAHRGRYVRSIERNPGGARIAVDATLRAAARSGRSPFRITAADLRYKQLKQKTGLLIIFAVDASGSMAMNRIGHAKGALLRLLGEAYVHRDRTALIAFRGDRAEVVLPPSRSVERARRAVDAMRVGGGTPLAAGLRAALGVAVKAKREPLLVLFTDGGANVPLSGNRDDVWREVRALCEALKSEGAASVIIDTSAQSTAGGNAELLARFLGGRFARLPRARPNAAYEIVAEAAKTARLGRNIE